MIRSMAYLLSLAGILSLAPAEQALANKLLEWVRCSTDITEEIRPSIRGTMSLQSGIGWLDGEIYNDSRNLKVTSATIKVTGTYAGGREFTRKFKQARDLLPGYSERLLIELGVRDVEEIEWSILELRGCKSSR